MFGKFECLVRVCEKGSFRSLESYFLVLSSLIVFLLILPLSFMVQKSLGIFTASTVVAVFFSTFLAVFLYAPAVDRSFVQVAIVINGYLGIPVFISSFIAQKVYVSEAKNT